VTSGAAEAGGVKAYLFSSALEGKKYWLRNGGYVNHSVWDTLVFSKIKARIGLDRCRLMVTGSAPLAAHVMEFLRCAFGCPVVEGYGQTECCAAATATSIHEQASLGHVGTPLAANEIKLVSVPEMGYLATDKVHGREVGPDGEVLAAGIPCSGRGEICYRGHNVFPGYYKDAAKTAEVLEADGWLHSGDIGLWDAEGNLRVVDRKKNIFKLAQGEYVAAEKIEGALQRSHLVAQVFVYGDSLHSVLLAVVVPSEDGAKSWAKAHGKADGSLAALVADDEFKKAVLDDMTAQGRAAKLQVRAGEGGRGMGGGEGRQCVRVLCVLAQPHSAFPRSPLSHTRTYTRRRALSWSRRCTWTRPCGRPTTC
jgi:long-chain acyl-CoA synthetase